VITVLVQAARRAEGVGPMVEAMAMLGRAGIRPDEDTMEVDGRYARAQIDKDKYTLYWLNTCFQLLLPRHRLV
jgi:hypothetical protein